jgi:hypothetical protein
MQDEKKRGGGIPKFTHGLFGIQFIYNFNISVLKYLDLKKIVDSIPLSKDILID